MNDTGTDKRDHPYVIIDNAVIDKFGLMANELALYVVIARFINQKTGVAFPSVRVLSERAGMDKRTVLRTIPRLEAVGLLRVERTEGRGNHYELLDPHPPQPVTESHQPGDTESPVDESGPVTESHQPGDTESPGSDTESPVPVTESHPTNTNTTNTIQKEDLQERSTTDSRESTDSAAGPSSPVVVDEESQFIRDSVESFGFPDGLAEVEQLRAMPSVDALAYMLKARARANDGKGAGLLITMLRMQQPPPSEMVERVSAALELRTLDAGAIDRHLRAAEYEHFEQAVTRHLDTVAPARPAPAGDSGLGQRTDGVSSMTWRDAWRATLGQLSLQLNRSTYTNWVEGTQAVAYADGVLTVRARSIMAKATLERQLKPAIEDSLKRLIGQPVRVEVVTADPAPVAIAAGASA